MPKKAKIEEFLETALGSAGKLQTLILLVNRGIVLLKEAKVTPAVRQTNIVKTQNILAQLERALNFKKGKLAGNLFFIYDYLFDELSRRDSRGIDVSIRMLAQLRDTFTALQKQAHS